MSFYRSHIENHIVPAFGHLPMHRIKTPQVSRWFHDLGRTMPTTADGCLNTLCNMYRRAAAWSHLKQRTDLRFFRIRRYRPQQRARHALNGETFRALGRAMTRLSKLYPAGIDIIAVLIFTGLSRGEVMGLRWSQVDGGTLHFPQRAEGLLREVPVGSAVQTILERRRLTRDSEFVFPSPWTPTKPQANIAYVWDRLHAAARLPKGFLAHDLHHSFEFHALLGGESPYLVRRLQGYVGVNSWAPQGKVTDGETIKAAERIARHLASLLGPMPLEDFK